MLLTIYFLLRGAGRKFFLLAFLVLFLPGCTTINGVSGLTINGIVFQNHTTRTITNVRAHVAKTNAFAHCSPVHPDKECSTSFQVKHYQGHPVRISWEQNGKKWSTGEFIVSPPERIVPDKPVKVLIVISGDGIAQAIFIQ